MLICLPRILLYKIQSWNTGKHLRKDNPYFNCYCQKTMKNIANDLNVKVEQKATRNIHFLYTGNLLTCTMSLVLFSLCGYTYGCGFWKQLALIVSGKFNKAMNHVEVYSLTPFEPVPLAVLFQIHKLQFISSYNLLTVYFFQIHWRDYTPAPMSETY